MKILAISDLHGYLPEIPECDLLLIGGDVCPIWNHHTDIQRLWLQSDFDDWLGAIPATKVVGIAGNHDFAMQKFQGFGHSIKNWTYLEDDSYEYDGLLIHGTPWVPEFGNWAFMRPDNLLDSKWSKIPDDVDILIVHGPPHMTLDRVMGSGNWNEATNSFDKYVGSRTLEVQLDRMTNLKAIITGHIHEGYGKMGMGEGKPVVYNASHMDYAYEPNNKVMEIALP